MHDEITKSDKDGDAAELADEPFSMEVLLSLTRVGGGWLRQRHVFQYMPNPAASALAVALCSHTSPVDSLMVDDRRQPMCPSCLDIVMDRYVFRVGLDYLVQALSPRPRITGTAGPAK